MPPMRSALLVLFLVSLDARADWMQSAPPLAAAIRPADGMTVQQTPPDFSWPEASRTAQYTLNLTYPDGKTRSDMSNSNGNNIWAGTKNPDLTWKWVSYMGSQDCQTTAGASGTFFPSIPASMNNTASSMAKQGVDLSVFTDEERNHELFTAVDYNNGAALQTTLTPLFEAYFAHQKNDDFWPSVKQAADQLLDKS